MLANALRVEEPQIRVIAPHVGGAFGLKMHGHPEEPLVCVLSRVVGRPVKWIEDRRESLLIGGREHVHRFAVGFNDDGTISALRDHFTANVGAIGAVPAGAWRSSPALCVPDRLQDPQHRRAS